MPAVDFSTNKIQAYALIDGLEIEIYQYRDSWALNAIPECWISCAIGRDCETGEAAAIHDIVDTFKINLPVQIFAIAAELASSVNDSGDDWPGGEFLLFNGLIVGSSFNKSKNGTASLVLHCRHVLMQLEYAMTNTRTTHPRGPGNFNMPAGIRVNNNNAGFTGNTTAAKYFTKDNIEQDLWDKALTPWLLDVIKTKSNFVGEDIAPGNGSVDAFNVITNIFEPTPNDGNKYLYGVPLEINPVFPVLGFDSAIKAIANDISKTMLESFYGSTIWEKLDNYASNYLFAIVPMVSRALVVPFIPGLRATWVTIDPSEYVSIEEANSMPRGLYGVVIYTGANSMIGPAGFMRGVAGANNKVGGEYYNSDLEGGMIVFRDGPNWLNNAANGQGWGKDAAGPGKVIGNAMNPGAGAPPVAGNPGNARQAANTIWDAYAHGVYLYEVLKNRKMSITGKLRFDIAVGSSVELISDEELFVAQQTGLTPDEAAMLDEPTGSASTSYFGMVTRIQNIIDSEAVQTQTNIELSYVNDEIEHAQKGTSTDNHPLYTSVWLGAPLVDDFDPEVEPIPGPVGG